MIDDSAPDISQLHRSWHTRMESIFRQFNSLAQGHVFSADGQRLTILGLHSINHRRKLAVCSAELDCPVFTIDASQVTPAD
jgi:hypothetical protein